MIQTVMMAQALVSKAALVDVRPLIGEWRRANGLPQDPLDAFRQSGYLDRISRERAGRDGRDTSRYA